MRDVIQSGESVHGSLPFGIKCWPYSDNLIMMCFLCMKNELTNPCLVVFARFLIGVGQDKANRAPQGPGGVL